MFAPVDQHATASARITVSDTLWNWLRGLAVSCLRRGARNYALVGNTNVRFIGAHSDYLSLDSDLIGLASVPAKR